MLAGAQAHFGLGNLLHYKRGLLDAAESEYREALRLRPDYANVRIVGSLPFCLFLVGSEDGWQLLCSLSV